MLFKHIVLYSIKIYFCEQCEKDIVVGWIVAPHKPVNVTLYGKTDFADVIKVRILKWEDYLVLSWWTWCNHKGPYKKEVGNQGEHL